MEEENRVSGGGSALKALVSFFTIWHQDITQEDMDEMERRFHLVPLVGLLFAAAIAIEMTVMVVAVDRWGVGSSLLMAAVVLATVYGGSKFLHFDGLTDFGDGMIVSGTREDHVRALKDTLVGAGGIGVALITVLMSVSVYAMAGVLLLILAPLAEVMVKNAMVAAAAFGKPGNGMAGRQVAMTTNDSLVRSSVLSLVTGAVLGIALTALFNAIMGWSIGFRYLEVGYAAVIVGMALALLASIAVGYLMARRSNDTFGMVNGDILGATNEMARPVVMLLMAIPVLVWM